MSRPSRLMDDPKAVDAVLSYWPIPRPNFDIGDIRLDWTQRQTHTRVAALCHELCHAVGAGLDVDSERFRNNVYKNVTEVLAKSDKDTWDQQEFKDTAACMVVYQRLGVRVNFVKDLNSVAMALQLYVRLDRARTYGMGVIAMPDAKYVRDQLKDYSYRKSERTRKLVQDVLDAISKAQS